MINNNYPIIGISGSIIIDQGGMFPGYERAYVNNDYVQTVANCNAIPYILPIIQNEKLITKQLENVDGLILSGGHDTNPLIYGEELHKTCGDILPKRDLYDIKLFKIAKKLQIPILGICRGAQIINICEGGSLYQDLSLKNNSYIKHNQQHLSNVPSHTINIYKNTKLYNIFEKEEIMVNSFHHQALKKVAPNYKISAIAKDGVIEAIEKEGDCFIVGVQFHPEMLFKDFDIIKKLFIYFINESKKTNLSVNREED